MDGAHTHGHGPTGLGELVAIGAGIALAAMVLARVLTFLLIGLAVAGGLLVIGLIGYVVARLPPLPAGHRAEAAHHPGRSCPRTRPGR